jgi:hypothetical protein
MQVFILRSDLTGASDENARVMASYDDAIVVDMAWHPNATVLTVTPDAIQNTGGIPNLFSGWRNTMQTPVLSGEASRRINNCFPDYSQRNANAEINGYITLYGTTVSTWPTEAQSRKAEIDRCWTYVNDVRGKANAMGEQSLPVDPTADANWPTVASPYVPS